MMSYAGFNLTHLTLKGPNISDAEIRFQAGLNVIYGASDTGKTFIAQCVDYMFGASKTPKDIPEARPYDTICLGIRESNSIDEIVLERSLRGGDFRLVVNGMEDRLLGAKHQANNEETVSYLFLTMSGLRGNMVRVNQRGETRPLSFRDIARLVLISESSVITELSPIFSGHRMSQIVESSVFRFLLTGVDDSSVIAKRDPKIAKGVREGKSEVIEALLEKEREKISELEVVGDEKTLLEQLTQVEKTFENASARLAEVQQSAAKLEAGRREAWEKLRHVDSRLGVVMELQKRFELLQEQYASDLGRLESISEASARLNQMEEERCPVCGALAEHHDFQHQSPQASPEDVISSCKAEAEKIRTLIIDLNRTLKDNQEEVALLKEKKKASTDSLQITNTEIREILQPRIQAAIQKIKESQVLRDKIRRAIELLRRIRELEQLLTNIEKAPKRERAEGPATKVGADEAEEFSQIAEDLLRSWHFPELDRVTFSEEDQDLVISGIKRSSHGKGIRAITHSAFNLALLKYCKTLSKPHPRFVLIDSPLIVYRQPDPGEDTFTQDVKEGFYRSLATTFMDTQVIILENDPPPADLAQTVNIIQFTGITGVGRKGFIPDHG